MRSQRVLLIVALSMGLAGSAWAGPFSFLRKKQQPPQQPAQPAQSHVSDLVLTLKTDPDAGRREAAAEQLRDHDIRLHPEVVPVLIEAAQRDAKPEVRLAAVQSLARLRPVTTEIGRVIEQVVSGDSSMRVRMSARTTLWQYQLAGYRGGNTPAGPGGPPLGAPPATQEPPLADPVGETGPPLLPVQETPSGPSLYPQPLPVGPPLQPTQPPRLAPVPAGRRTPTSWAPTESSGPPLSSYRLIAPPVRTQEVGVDHVVAPLRHEEVVPAQPAPLRKFMVDLPAPGLEPHSMPQSPVEVVPLESGPMLTAPQ